MVVLLPMLGYVPPVVFGAQQSYEGRAFTSARMSVLHYLFPRASTHHLLHALRPIDVQPALSVPNAESFLP